MLNNVGWSSMNLIDEYRCIIGAYYGVKSMDNYDLKEYVLKDIEDYVKNFIEINPIDDFDYRKEANIVNEKTSLITKLQDSLIILSRLNQDLELILLIKKKIRELKKNN